MKCKDYYSLLAGVVDSVSEMRGMHKGMNLHTYYFLFQSIKEIWYQ